MANGIGLWGAELAAHFRLVLLAAWYGMASSTWGRSLCRRFFFPSVRSQMAQRAHNLRQIPRKMPQFSLTQPKGHTCCCLVFRSGQPEAQMRTNGGQIEIGANPSLSPSLFACLIKADVAKRPSFC